MSVLQASLSDYIMTSLQEGLNSYRNSNITAPQIEVTKSHEPAP